MPARGGNKSFTVVLARSGLTLEVPGNRTILQVLQKAGVKVKFSCRQGFCGTCEVSVLEGAPEHRDTVLTDEEKQSNSSMMICCSRSLSDLLVLDL